jgi:hypothetical protein
MKTSESFALNQWLSYYPENMTYQEIIDAMTIRSESHKAEYIDVWAVVQDYDLDQVADYIEDTRKAFERATA